MIATPTFYDWPSSVIPARQLYHAGGQMVDGGFTSAGARLGYPEPGGRAFLELEFGYQDNAPADPIVSWLCSKVANGNVFRIPIWRSPQVLSEADIGLSGLDAGLPWAAEGLLPERSWDNGNNWEYEVGAAAVSASLEGTTEITIDVGDLPVALRPGHVIGHNDTAYKVDDLEWDDTVATIRLMTPLRADVDADAFITFRPKMLVVATNPDSFRGLYQPADLIQLGSARFIEAIL